MRQANELKPVAEDLKKSGDQLQKELESRPECQRVNDQTTDASDGFVDSQRRLTDLVEQLENYSGVSEEFAKSYEDLEKWLPEAKEQVSTLKPISTQPDVIEEQIHETEVSIPLLKIMVQDYLNIPVNSMWITGRITAKQKVRQKSQVFTRFAGRSQSHT